VERKGERASKREREREKRPESISSIYAAVRAVAPAFRCDTTHRSIDNMAPDLSASTDGASYVAGWDANTQRSCRGAYTRLVFRERVPVVKPTARRPRTRECRTTIGLATVNCTRLVLTIR